MEEQPRLRVLAGRCFEHAGDVEEALQLVLSSTGIQRSRHDLLPLTAFTPSSLVVQYVIECHS